MDMGLFGVDPCMPLCVPVRLQVWTKAPCLPVDSPLSTGVRRLLSSEGDGSAKGGRGVLERRGPGRAALRVLGETGRRGEGGRSGVGGAGGGDSPPLPSPAPAAPIAPASPGALAERRRQQRRRPGHRDQIDAGTDTATAAAAGLSPGRERRWERGGPPSPAAPVSPPWRRPGRMLQMVKTLAQFTIALEDMRDLGPATASGEPAGSSGADAEEPGEAQVRGGGRRPGTWAKT